MVDAETLQRAFGRLTDVLGPPVDAARRRIVGVADEAELRREQDLIAAVGHGAPEESLVGVRTVGVGGVEEGHAQVERAMDRGHGLGVVAVAVELGHTHAAKAEGGDGRALEAQCACLHGSQC